MTLIAAALRLATLPYLSFYDDEAWTLCWSQQSVGYILGNIDTGLSMHLYLLFIKFWMKLVGNSELALKAPSLLAGIIAIPVLYFIGRRLADRHVASLAVLLATFSLPLIEFSRYARVYAILVIVTMLTMGLYVRALRKGRRKDFLLLGLVNGVALTLSGNAGYIMLVQGASVVIETVCHRQRDWKKLLSFTSSFIFSLLLALAFYFSALKHVLPMTLASTGSEGWRVDLFVTVFKNFHPCATPVMFAFLILGGWQALWRHAAIGRLLLIWTFFPMLFFILIGARQPEWAIARFLVITVPAHCLLISMGIIWISRKLMPTLSIKSSALFLLALIGVGLALSPNAYQRLFSEMYGSAAAVSRIKDKVQTGDVVTTDPDYLQWLIRQRVNAPYLNLSDLVQHSAQKQADRLVILTFGDDTAIQFWSHYFSTEIISGPQYMDDLVILTSPRLSDAVAFRQMLKAYLTGSLQGVKNWPRLGNIPSRLYFALASQHQLLAILNRHDELIDEADAHQHFADHYRQMGMAQVSHIR